jgi:hypothetical protein
MSHHLVEPVAGTRGALRESDPPAGKSDGLIGVVVEDNGHSR